MRLPFIGGEELAERLPMTAAVDTLERAFSQETVRNSPLRSHLATADGEVLLMPATSPDGTGVKLVALNPSNPARGLPFVQAVYVLFAPGSLEPVAVIDGIALTALRTGAVSGLATRYLALPDAQRLVVFGAGVQARSHLDAMVAVRPSIGDVTVVSRSPEPAERLAERGRAMGLRVSVGDRSSVTNADVVCTCTTSEKPLFDGETLKPGAHVNAVGSYQPHTRELDTATMRRGRIVVETREAVLAEAGELLIPIGEGELSADDVHADLSEVVRGKTVRRSPADVTVFKSVGVAFEDLAVALAALGAIQA